MWEPILRICTSCFDCYQVACTKLIIVAGFEMKSPVEYKIESTQQNVGSPKGENLYSYQQKYLIVGLWDTECSLQIWICKVLSIVKSLR